MKKKPRPTKPRQNAEFPYALKSFLGYLEGTSKAEHTLKSYRLDLLSLQKFFMEEAGSRGLHLASLNSDDLGRYHDWLKGQGLKSNTRRRKLLTVQKFFRYLAHRKKVPVELAGTFPTPLKIERLPFTVPSAELIDAIRKLPADPVLAARNRALLWVLAETGCLVSEATKLKADQGSTNGETGAQLEFGGKNARSVPISRELLHALQDLKIPASSRSDSASLFPGFNRFGSMGAAITPRGVELLVRSFATRLGWPELTPRTFRHSIALKWLEEGVAQEEIQRRLGLRSAYAFRIYDVLLQARVKSRSGTTSTA